MNPRASGHVRSGLSLVVVSFLLSGCIKDQVLKPDVDRTLSNNLTVEASESPDTGVNPILKPFLVVVDVATAGQLTRDTGETEADLSAGFSGLDKRYESLDAAIYLSPSVKEYVYSNTPDSLAGKARTAVVPLGYTLEKTFPKLADTVFNSVEVRDSAVAPEESKAVIVMEPVIESVVHRHALNGRVYFDVEMGLKARDAKGELLFDRSFKSGNVAGEAIDNGFASSAHVRALATSSTSALMVVSGNAMKSMLEDTEVESYLASAATPQLVAQCKHWNPVEGITDLDKAYQEAKSMLDKAVEDHGKKALEGLSDAAGTKNLANRWVDVNTAGGFYMVKLDDLQKGLSIVDKVLSGDFKGAAGDSTEWMLEVTMPAVALYRQLMVAGSSAVEAVVANWEQDMFGSEAYTGVVDLLNAEIMRGYKEKDPYLPSEFIKGDSEMKAEMKAREDAMFWRYEERFEMDMFDDGLWNRAVSKFGPTATSRDLFNGMLQQAIADQYGYIITTYERVTLDKMQREAWIGREQYVNATCKLFSQANS